MAETSRFHHAFPVADLSEAREFYLAALGCKELPRADPERSAGFDFFGHELVIHVVSPDDAAIHRRASGGLNASIRHFGVYLARGEWEAIVGRITRAQITVFGPVERADGAFVLVEDPSANVIEFKTITHAPR
jgi:extradiol dioxygenase family protein